MSLHITDDRITGDCTPETATYRPAASGDGRGVWLASWLPQRLLDRNQAITAIMLAETLAAGATPGDRMWPLVHDWAREIHITADEAQHVLSARAAEAVRSLLRQRHDLSQARNPHGTVPLHLLDERTEFFQPPPEEEAVRDRLTIRRGDPHQHHETTAWTLPADAGPAAGRQPHEGYLLAVLSSNATVDATTSLPRVTQYAFVDRDCDRAALWLANGWGAETPTPFVYVACACGWRTPPVATPGRTHLVRRPRASGTDAILLITDREFERHCRQRWHQHAAPSGPPGASTTP